MTMLMVNMVHIRDENVAEERIVVISAVLPIML